MTSRSATWMSLAAVVVLAAGCGGKPDQKGPVRPPDQKPEAAAAPAAEPEMSPVDRYAAEAFGQAETGNVDGAVAALERGLAELAGDDEKARLFYVELAMLFDAQRAEEAKARYLKALANPAEVALAAQTLGLVEDYLARGEGGHAAVVAWCDTLELAGLPEAMRVPVLRNRLSALLELDDFEKALELVQGRGWALPDTEAQGLISAFLQTALAKGRQADLDRALGWLEQKGADRAGMAALAASTRIEAALAGQDLAGASALLFARAGVLDDGMTAGLLDKLARAALAAQQGAVADQAAEKALTVFADRPATRARAARWFLIVAREANDLAMGVDRLERLEGLGFAVDTLVAGVGTLSSLVLPPATPAEAVGRLEAYTLKLKEKVREEPDVALLAGVLLDAGFRLEHYAGLIKVLEAGIPGHDAAWHQTMLNKIRAHLDLQEGRVDEAVARFRSFMKAIAAQDEQNHRDPVTDERVTKEMILGYNAKRIGEIYAQAGRKEEAAKAFEEARGYYAAALKGFAENDPETKTVLAILAELGKGAGG